MDVQQGGHDDDGLYTLDFQVWRPSPTTVDGSIGSGQYILVGNNRFTEISLSDNVAEISVRSQDQVQFLSGDVLGFYVEEATDSNRGVNVITTVLRNSPWKRCGMQVLPL